MDANKAVSIASALDRVGDIEKLFRRITRPSQITRSHADHAVSLESMLLFYSCGFHASYVHVLDLVHSRGQDVHCGSQCAQGDEDRTDDI